MKQAFPDMLFNDSFLIFACHITYGLWALGMFTLHLLPETFQSLVQCGKCATMVMKYFVALVNIQMVFILYIQTNMVIIMSNMSYS